MKSAAYVIAWTHRKEPFSRGKSANRYSKHEAEVMAAELNIEFPHVEHRAELAADRPTPDHWPSHD